MQRRDGKAGEFGHRQPRVALRSGDGYALRHTGQAQK
jgi:hypothetical protein